MIVESVSRWTIFLVFKSTINFLLKITVCGFRDIGDTKKLKFNPEEKQSSYDIDSDSTFMLGKNIIDA